MKKILIKSLYLIPALVILAFGIIYLFTDYSLFLYLTHTVSGIFIPVLFLTFLACIDPESKNRTIKVYRYSKQIDETIEIFKFHGYEVVDIKVVDTTKPLNSKLEIEFVKVRNKA